MHFIKSFKLKTKIILSLILLALAVFLFFAWKQIDHVRNVEFRATGQIFQIHQDGEWKDFPIKGVNMGVGKPGFFPGEMAVTKEEYNRWFKQISEMNANTVRVYTILDPMFYEALFEYNMTAKNPIYIFHGAWIDEELIAKSNNAFDPELLENYEQEISSMVDVLHGRIEIEPRTGHASGIYRWDVSPYIAGYILGIELDYEFVSTTNTLNKSVTSFDGKYLHTESASPYECFLARTGEKLIAYEYERYGDQKPVSWTNWLTTDTLEHSTEPDQQKEDGVSVNTEHILTKDTYTSGLFASYHIYPYYPDFMNYQPEYLAYIDDDGEPNPYKAYLLDLKTQHSVPMLVAEFGVPSSRGRTHENNVTGFHQGGLTETQQGEYDADMFDSIMSSGLAGGIVFTWQDEWFKRSWNTMDNDIPERRALWSNFQVSEQRYGLLAFDPGEKKTFSYPDGDISEWKATAPVCTAGAFALYCASDEEFVYFMLHDESGQIDKKKYIIAVDSVDGQGSRTYDDLQTEFSIDAENIILVNGKSSSRVLVDSYSDIWYRNYSLINIIPRTPAFEKKNSGIFNPVNLILSRELTLPLTGEVVPQSSYETGKLTYGIGNPSLKGYNSLADFYMTGDKKTLEIRIPWQLLNVADPSTRTMIGDIYKRNVYDINPTITNGFNLELKIKDENTLLSGGQGFFTWDTWELPSSHERLKESYYIIKQIFAKY